MVGKIVGENGFEHGCHGLGCLHGSGKALYESTGSYTAFDSSKQNLGSEWVQHAYNYSRFVGTAVWAPVN